MLLPHLQSSATLCARTLACTLVFAPRFHLPPGRVAQIELKMRHAAVGQMKFIPPGWRFLINNDGNFITKTTGVAFEIAFALESDDLSGLFSITPEPGYSCADVGRSNVPRLRVTLYRNERERRITIRPSELRWTDQ
jgi:hypothetical protein